MLLAVLLLLGCSGSQPAGRYAATAPGRPVLLFPPGQPSGELPRSWCLGCLGVLGLLAGWRQHQHETVFLQGLRVVVRSRGLGRQGWRASVPASTPPLFPPATGWSW